MEKEVIVQIKESFKLKIMDGDKILFDSRVVPCEITHNKNTENPREEIVLTIIPF